MQFRTWFCFLMDATSIAAGAFVFNVGCTVGIVVWAVANIKVDFGKQIASEREATSMLVAELRADFLRDQKTQDHNFGEVGSAIRQYIADLEKKLHEVEIWGRDHYAIKDDVRAMLDEIRAIRTDVKADFKELTAKIDLKA